jgi:hypothetical protein
MKGEELELKITRRLAHQNNGLERGDTAPAFIYGTTQHPNSTNFYPKDGGSCFF